VLGTDGFGRIDFRARLRHFFEVDRRFVALAALKALHEDGKLSADRVAAAVKSFDLDPDKPNPALV